MAIPGLDLHAPAACDPLRGTPNAVTVRVRIRRHRRDGLADCPRGRIFPFRASHLQIGGDETLQL